MGVRAAIRVAALPVLALEDMRCEKSWAAIAEVRRLDWRLRAGGPVICDELYEIIGRSASASRPALVALRRAVFNRRRLSPRLWNAEMRAELPPRVASRIDEWQRACMDRESLLGSLPALMAGETAEAAENLRKSVAEPAFRFGLVQGSPALFAELAKWLDAPGARPVARQTLLRLAKYLARVVAKTSPYSTFTLSGLVRWRPAGTSAIRTADGFSWTSVAELNVWMASRIVTGISKRPGAPELPLRVNPSLVTDHSTVRFLGGGLPAALMTVRRSAGLDECLRIVTQNPGITVSGLSQRLRELAPDFGDKEVGEFISRVVEIGVLEILSPFPDQSEDHLGELASWLAASSVPAIASLATEVRALRADLRGYPLISAAPERLSAHQRIGARLEQLIKAAEPAVADPVPGKNLFHENAVLTEPPAECGGRCWAPVLADLSALRGVFAALDPCLPARRALARVFAAEYGEGGRARWLDFYQKVGKLTRAGAGAAVAGVDGAVLSKLAAGPLATDPRTWAQLPFAAEQSAMRAALTALALARGEQTGTVTLTMDEMTGLVSDPEAAAVLTDPVTYYVQLTDAGDPPSVVLNTITAGRGRGITRTTRLLRMAGAASPEHDADVPAGAASVIEVESDGVFASNINLRSPATRYELDYPFTTSARSQRSRIPLRDLEVVHDPATGFLHLVRQGSDRRLRPVHGGLMAEFWLPAPLRHLVETFGPTPTLLHASASVLRPVDTDPREGGVWRLPRLTAGHVTLSRRSWAFSAAEMPARHKGEGDAAFWLRLADWTAEQGIPERFFLRLVSYGQEGGHLAQKNRKPTYIDLAIWHLVALLERGVESGRDLVVITEALPDLGAAPRYGQAAHVTELLIEIDGPGAEDD